MPPIFLALVLLFGLSCGVVNAQTNDELGENSSLLPDVLPEYPGGIQALYKLITDNVKYPKKCRRNDVEGTVIVQFVVNALGEAEQFEVLESPHEDLSLEALRVLGLMERWAPGMLDGKEVDVYFELPIRFALK